MISYSVSKKVKYCNLWEGLILYTHADIFILTFFILFYYLALKKLMKNPGKCLQKTPILIKVTTTKFPKNNCL